jgi:L-2-hydroxyglutarate oxidase LhgO
MNMESVDAVVIGAGVVGLAVGRALARRGVETWVLEREGAIGTGASSRNSEVIHAGLYHPPGSLKARLCVEGRERLYVYCASRGVAHRRCGKLVVATAPEQLPALEQLAARALANGVSDVHMLSATEARELEPALQCDAALLSPSTGIVDSHGLMLALQGDLEAAGGMLALRAPVLAIRCGRDGHEIEVGGGEPVTLRARRVINAAGLHAPTLAAAFHGLDVDLVPRARFMKGSYYALSGKAPFARLVYPVPAKASLGVHLTLDLAGQARFGPDEEWLAIDDAKAIDYAVDPGRASSFYADVRRYWPGLLDGTLQPAYSGVRPKIQGPGEAVPDFCVQGAREHGVPGLVNLFGIESPGLTSCLALADEVLTRLDF